ncbi:copper chaperone PCu(A)C [Falsiroseomonas sp. HW251]|uniref:copper chaperone PCu(A)C n=1 Tax=Falsiroseomonas sp. HW251 TaxID=3390998 RepID=UPI003D313748
MTAIARRAALGALAGFVVLPAAAQQPAVRVEQPWTRAAGAGATGAGFMILRNTAAVPDRLVSARSPAARAVELHTSYREGDVMRMRPVQGIDLPAGQAVTLAPGGFHLMLVGLAAATRQGEQVPLTLVFEKAGEVTVQLPVQSAGARGPAAAHQH